MPCFNDDVQGTGCVTLAAIMAALHLTDEKLADVRMVVFGAGTAGVGIADQVRDAIATEGDMSKEEAAKRIWYVAASVDMDGRGEVNAMLTATLINHRQAG